MAKSKSNMAAKRDQILKIASEVIVGVIFASGNFPVMIFLYSPFLRAFISMGPSNSSGSVNFVRR